MENTIPTVRSLCEKRLASRWDELRRLWLELCPDGEENYPLFLDLLHRSWRERPRSLREQDRRREGDPDWYRRRDRLAMELPDAEGLRERLPYLKECGVSYIFLPGPAPEGLESLAAACRRAGIRLCLPLPAEGGPLDLAEALLSLANRGADLLRLDLDRTARGGTLARFLRLTLETVCPGVLLLGEGPAVDPSVLGNAERPACHMACSASSVPVLWHSLASGEVSLLKRELEDCAPPAAWACRLNLPEGFRWALDYPFLRQSFGADETAHRRYLNDWFTGAFPGSRARGALGEDGLLRGSTAALCGLEGAGDDPLWTARALSLDLTLHALLLSRGGLPILQWGDELGLCAGERPGDLAARREDAEDRPGKLFSGLRRLAALRAREPCFDPDALRVPETMGVPGVLALRRRKGRRELLCLYNLTPEFVKVPLSGGLWSELMYGGRAETGFQLYPFGFAWLLRENA